jgi:hypothetical protein
MQSDVRIINGNKVYRDGEFWKVESADGSWDGFELYDTEQEAIEAAELDMTGDEDDDEYWDNYTPSATHGDYSPSCPWNAPGMSISDFI